MKSVMKCNLFNILTADWTNVWTAQEAEVQLTGFKFSGPGFYIEKNNTLLVVPNVLPNRTIWNNTWPASQEFMFVFYTGDISEALNLLVNAPVRLDERE